MTASELIGRLAPGLLYRSQTIPDESASGIPSTVELVYPVAPNDLIKRLYDFFDPNSHIVNVSDGDITVRRKGWRRKFSNPVASLKPSTEGYELTFDPGYSTGREIETLPQHLQRGKTLADLAQSEVNPWAQLEKVVTGDRYIGASWDQFADFFDDPSTSHTAMAVAHIIIYAGGEQKNIMHRFSDAVIKMRNGLSQDSDSYKPASLLASMRRDYGATCK